jgi:isoleucyl-tRNA synthetase
VEITTEDIPGWLIANSGIYTVALDTTLTDELISEGKARDLVNKIQSLRKEKGFEVTDKINLTIQKHPEFDNAFEDNFSYICSETLAESFKLSEKLQDDSDKVEMTESISLLIDIKKA